MGYMLGAWDNTHIICGNHGDDLSHEMSLQQFGKSLEYVCPCYFKEGRKEGEEVCNNKIPLSEFEKILEHIANELLLAEENNEVVHLTNRKWKSRKGTLCHVLSHDDTGFTVKVLNPLK